MPSTNEYKTIYLISHAERHLASANTQAEAFVWLLDEAAAAAGEGEFIARWLELDAGPRESRTSYRIVITDDWRLIRPALAFALIDLAMNGVVLQSIGNVTQSPSAGRRSAPDPRVIATLTAALKQHRSGYRLKRALDIIVSAAALLLAAPLLLILALVVRLTSPGPAFFVQERLGRLRVPFPCIKFRTMMDRAESLTGPVWASAGDSRVTRVGRWLRKSRLDELPQLLNVLLGHMSIVGPRPIRKHFADQLAQEIPFYDLRFLERPGLTGWAQVKYKYPSSVAEHAEKFLYEYTYIRRPSLAFDLYIMLSTLPTMLRMEGL